MRRSRGTAQALNPNDVRAAILERRARRAGSVRGERRSTLGGCAQRRPRPTGRH